MRTICTIIIGTLLPLIVLIGCREKPKPVVFKDYKYVMVVTYDSGLKDTVKTIIHNATNPDPYLCNPYALSAKMVIFIRTKDEDGFTRTQTIASGVSSFNLISKEQIFIKN